jgi:hypothetical protein
MNRLKKPKNRMLDGTGGLEYWPPSLAGWW